MDLPGLAETRMQYTNHPNAQKPPFVLKGGHIAALTFWHGAMMNDWANRWVSYWSEGKTDFVTSAMEETGTYLSIEYLHNAGFVDKNRFMVLRAGSNYTMQPPGVGAAENLLRENDGPSRIIQTQSVGPLRHKRQCCRVVSGRSAQELSGCTHRWICLAWRKPVCSIRIILMRKSHLLF